MEPSHSAKAATCPDSDSDDESTFAAETQCDKAQVLDKFTQQTRLRLARWLKCAVEYLQPRGGKGLRTQSIDGDWFLGMPRSFATVHLAGTMQFFTHRCGTVVMAARGRELM